MGIEILNDGSLKKIYVIGHSHHDYAWERERQWHILRYCMLFNETLNWLKANPDATWLIDNVVHSLLPFFENYPERIGEFKDYVKEGRIEVSNGGYSLARPSYVGEETFVRNLQVGDEYFKKLLDIGEIPYYLNVDTASGQRQMPQILKLAGFKYYKFQRPEISLNQRKIPRVFWWKGLDGSEILVARSAGVGFFHVRYSNMDYDTRWDEIRRAFFDEELAARRPDGLFTADTELIPYGCDDSCPPLNWFDKEIKLDEFVKEWNRREPVELKFGTTRQYFEELAQKDLPVFEGGLDDAELTFNLPGKGDRSMWRMRGDLDKLIVRLENVCAICAFMGIPYPEDEINGLWLQLFEITGHAIDWVLQSDDLELLTIAENARTKAEMMIKNYLTKLAGNVKYTDGLLAAVVNTQARERCETVRMCVTDPRGVKKFKLYDAAGGELDYQIVDRNSFFCVPEEWRRHDYVSVDVVTQVKTPAFGYNAITVKYTDNPIDEESAQIKLISLSEAEIPTAPETEIDAGALEIKLSKGRITKLTDKNTGGTIRAKDGGSLYGFRCVTTEPYKDWMYENKVTGEASFVPDSWKLIECGPIRWRYRVCGSFMEGQRAVLDILINRGSPTVEFELELDTKPLDCYYTVDFSCDGGTKSHADVYFGVEPRDTGEIAYNYGEAYIDGQIYGRNFVAFECNSQPLALASGNCSVYYIHDAKKRRMSLLLTRNCLYSDSKVDWVRKMPQTFALDGKNHFRFALIASDRYGSFGGIQQCVKGYHHPLQVGLKFNQNKTAGLPGSASFIENPADTLVQSAIYRKNGFVYIRLFETEGKEAKLSLALPAAVKSVKSVDFLGCPTPEQFVFDEKSHTLTGTVGKFKIVTLECGV